MKFKYKIEYTPQNKTRSFDSWLLHFWSFFTTIGPESLRESLDLPKSVNGFHETGIRICGITISWTCLAQHVPVRKY